MMSITSNQPPKKCNPIIGDYADFASYVANIKGITDVRGQDDRSFICKVDRTKGFSLVDTNQQLQGMSFIAKKIDTQTISIQPTFFNFKSLPKELQIIIANKLPKSDLHALVSALWCEPNSIDCTNDGINTQKAILKIKQIPIVSLDTLDKALNIANSLPKNLRHEPLQTAIDRLVFLPIEDWQAGKEKVTSYLKALKQDEKKALQFINWAISIKTVETPNLTEREIYIRLSRILDRMRDGKHAKVAVEQCIPPSCNKLDKKVMVRYAQEIEINGFPNLCELSIKAYKKTMTECMRKGFNIESALEESIAQWGKINDHDKKILVLHAQAIKMHGLPNLTFKEIVKYEHTIETDVENGMDAQDAFKNSVDFWGRVNDHDKEKLMEFAENIAKAFEI